MNPINKSSVTEFILLGLNTDPQMQVLIFLLLLLIYILTLVGNISILVVVCTISRLQTPMYVFLGSLSFLDIGYSSVNSPKILVDFFVERKTISFLGCVAQLFFFVGFGSSEFFLLAAMAYDRNAAICNPLLYAVTMPRNVCAELISGSYLAGFLHSLIHAGCIFRVSFCGPNQIHHFVCDYPALLRLSCNNISINELARFTLASFVMVSSLFVVLVSYTYIVIAVMRIRTQAGRHRAFSTCASHFTCVLLFYGTIIFMYLKPNSSFSDKQDNVVSIFYMLVIPMLNPLIYSMRNQEVKGTLKKILCSIKNFKCS